MNPTFTLLFAKMDVSCTLLNPKDNATSYSSVVNLAEKPVGNQYYYDRIDNHHSSAPLKIARK